MSRTHRVKCRLVDCDETATFDTQDALLDSEWADFSRLSTRQLEGWTRLAYCPGHALERDG